MESGRGDAPNLSKQIEGSVASTPQVSSSSVRRPRKSSARPPINLLVTSEYQMGCQLLKGALQRARANFNVIATAVTRADIIQCLKTHTVDIALISDNLHGEPLSGFKVIDELRTLHPDIRIILLLQHPRKDFVIDAFRAGARGVFSYDESFETLCACIQAVRDGQIWATSAQLLHLLEALADAKPLRVVDSLGARLPTKREDAVVDLVADGLTNREIARNLSVTEHTIGNYLFRIYEKLGISSRVELVLYSLNQKQKQKDSA